ncbi:glyoxalase superfamily protein [Roseovarius sp. B08]|uniref:glyoxalase superfamily protein n=1 Tax=Roseovarius sp. B08 TaxID=3449223 RepID=UPI003EDC3AFC
MTQTTLPPRDVLKGHARNLRQTLGRAGTPISHSTALEHVAHQWGFRDWNTLSDAVPVAAPRAWTLGQRVSGRYLGHDFTGTVRAARRRGPNHVELGIDFDTPVDVVASPRFSALRQRVTFTIGATGRTVEKTSDGQPHVVLDLT